MLTIVPNSYSVWWFGGEGFLENCLWKGMKFQEIGSILGTFNFWPQYYLTLMFKVSVSSNDARTLNFQRKFCWAPFIFWITHFVIFSTHFVRKDDKMCRKDDKMCNWNNSLKRVLKKYFPENLEFIHYDSLLNCLLFNLIHKTPCTVYTCRISRTKREIYPYTTTATTPTTEPYIVITVTWDLSYIDFPICLDRVVFQYYNIGTGSSILQYRYMFIYTTI